MLGESGGRSRQHPTATGARRRATDRERSLVDPPADQLHRWHPAGAHPRVGRSTALVLALALIGVALTDLAPDIALMAVGNLAVGIAIALIILRWPSGSPTGPRWGSTRAAPGRARDRGPGIPSP